MHHRTKVQDAVTETGAWGWGSQVRSMQIGERGCEDTDVTVHNGLEPVSTEMPGVISKEEFQARQASHKPQGPGPRAHS